MGKNLQYEVEWEGYAERTWEPAAFLENNLALTAWEESGKAAWEASTKKRKRS